MTSRNRNKLLVYLQERGVLDNGTPEEIAAAKRDYRRRYDRVYKRQYRLRHSEVRFTLSQEERGMLVRAAGAMDGGTYAKQATLARAQGEGSIEGLQFSRELLQRVALIHSEVRHLCRQRPTGFLERRAVYDRLVEQIGALEEALREILKR